MIGGSLVCVKRASGLDFYSVDRPKIIRDSNKDIVSAECSQGWQSCGSHDSNHDYELCIPNDMQCPVVDLSYQLIRNADNSTSMVMVESQNLTSLPLIQLTISENGPPCIDSTQENATPNKDHFLMYVNDYFKSCETTIEGYQYNPLYREVQGFTKVSEFTLF